MDEWLRELAADLGIDDDVAVEPLLDTARVVAHSVERRATPLTTYLIGVAVGRTGADLEQLCQRVAELANRWERGPG